MGSIASHPALPVITGSYVPVHKPKPKIDDKSFNGQPMVDIIWYDEAAEITPEMIKGLSADIQERPPAARWIPCPGPKLTLWLRFKIFLKKRVDRSRTIN